jgi:hypothetical protein
MPRITVAPLSAEQIDTVYPLVREIAPALSQAAWRRRARRAIGPSRPDATARAGASGIMVARRDGRPFPCGLFCYRKEHDLARGDVLVARNFVALDILDPRPVRAALVAELEALAPRLGCPTVRAAVGQDGAELALVLADAGHRQEGRTLGKAAAAGWGAACPPAG